MSFFKEKFNIIDAISILIILWAIAKTIIKILNK
jgi:hypothetical protein